MESHLAKQLESVDKTQKILGGIVKKAEAFSDEAPRLQENEAPMARGHVMGGVPVYPARTALMVRTYALPKQVPEQLQFDSFLLRYIGFDANRRNPDVIWGIFGTDSLSRANVYASKDAEHGGRRLYMMDLWYKIERKPGGAQCIAEDIRATGFVNIQRLDADYRAYLLSLFLQRLEEENDPELEKLQLERSIEELVAQRPMLIHWFMKNCPWVYAVQHPVYIAQGVMLRIMTLRRDPDRYLSAHVRYNPEIRISVQGEPPVANVAAQADDHGDEQVNVLPESIERPVEKVAKAARPGRPSRALADGAPIDLPISQPSKKPGKKSVKKGD